MPLYRVLTRPGLLTGEQRVGFSHDVVDIHCRVTGAPRSFVHVLYATDDAGELDDGTAALVFGTIRAGRNGDQKKQITDDLSTALAARAGIDPAEVVAVSADIQASYVMEGGKLLPEPGSSEEDDWKALGA